MLPDLDASADTEIVADNVRVVQAIYFADQLESMRAFQVVDRLVELFQQGALPLGRGQAGKLLQRYGSGRDRLSEAERRDLFARALGAPGGDATDPHVNREFPTLWMRLISSVAMFECERSGSATDGQAAMAARGAVAHAARSLAANASAHGAGLVSSARRLSVDANALRAVLEAPEIRQAYGARDMWQVIDQVALTELGGPVNVTRYRRLAHAGSAVLQWVADRAADLSEPLTSCAELPFQDLVDAVEQWLAASGADDDAGEDAGPSLRLQRIAHELIRFAGLHVLLGHGGVAALEGALLRGDLVTFFCGAASTGKTLGAHAVAAALSRDLVRVDLSRIVTKYFGETEKSLEAVLSDAERTGAVLLLDEADALFGKRSGVHDAHDRYATVERDALLRRLRAHKGVVIFECSAEPVLAEGDWKTVLNQVARFPRPPVTR